MSEPLAIALIGAAGVVLVALIGLAARVNIVVSRVRRDAAETKEQVTNHHSTNMRVEQDDRHNQNTEAIAALRSEVSRGFDEMRYEFRALWGKAGANTERIDRLEDTQPTRRGKHT